MKEFVQTNEAPQCADEAPQPRSPGLKPCPFCGAAARIESLLSGPYVTCIACGGETRCYSTQDQAIATWNRRPAEAQVEALRKALKQIVGTTDGFFSVAMPLALRLSATDAIARAEPHPTPSEETE